MTTSRVRYGECLCFRVRLRAKPPTRHDCLRFASEVTVLDPMLSLAFSMHAHRGGYALLLGSGISRAAGIPTGYQVVLDLIRRIAAVEHEDPGPDPEAWFQTHFGEAPEYSAVLEKLGKTTAERARLLTQYFEASEEEREQGKKQPTAAHHAVAQLVAREYVRVVITTNFDPLLEQAMEALGINPTVVSSPDAAEGIPPLSHASRLVIKVNGDYRDARIKNSAAELEQYDSRMNVLLDRVFDEFGLVVCGWSGEWDTALRAALERCKNRRYTTYWTTLSANMAPRTRSLLELRAAATILIKGADDFFRDLDARLRALEDVDRPHPLTRAVAIATLKRYLPQDSDRIRLRDLVMDEVRSALRLVSKENATAREFSSATLLARLKGSEAATETLRGLVAHGCYWSRGPQGLWRDCLVRMSTVPKPHGWNYTDLNLKYYPALLLLYVGGFGCLCNGNYDILKQLFYDVLIREDDYHEPEQAVSVLHTHNVVAGNIAKSHMPGYERRHTPLSDYLCALLEPELREFLPNPAEYENAFDHFEYLKALAFVDVRQGNVWCPLGRFAWRNRYDERDIVAKINREVERAGPAWAPLRAGFFDGRLERFHQVNESLSGFLQTVRGQYL